jgi:guanylate kinase
VNRFPLVLSAPSGGGKTSIARKLIEMRADVGYSISCTTRPPRSGEVDGRDYHFWSEEQFLAARERGDFAETAVVHGRLYGTLRSEMQRVLESGRHVVMDVDVQGAERLASVFPDAVLVFVLPPSLEALLERLGGRGSEGGEELKVRLASARHELLQVHKYDYVVVNDDLAAAVGAVGAIIDAEMHRGVRFPALDSRVAGLVQELDARLGPVSATETAFGTK